MLYLYGLAVVGSVIVLACLFWVLSAIYEEWWGDYGRIYEIIETGFAWLAFSGFILGVGFWFYAVGVTFRYIIR